ncbi:MAG: hypothetical protein JWO74_4096 [Solirubrobacterales bacterium]|nr:hypothetical protein [Solirubrobacterales bacterium]
MSALCPHCGEHVRGGDRFCVGCGQEVAPGAQPSDAGAAFRSPDHPQRRAGDFLVRHRHGLMALAVIAGIATVVAVTGASSDTTPGPADSAPAPAVAAEADRQQTDRRTSGSTTTTAQEPTAKRVVTAEGADGKTYSCAFDVLDRVDAAKGRVSRREDVLKARRAAVRRLEKQYPRGRAPGSIIDRYHKLVARANAQVTWTNKAIHQYNRVLRDACDPK